MADEADRANGEIESALAEARWQAQQQARTAPALRPNGKCHFCEECVTGKLLFCSTDCRDDFAAEEEAIKRLGRR